VSAAMLESRMLVGKKSLSIVTFKPSLISYFPEIGFTVVAIAGPHNAKFTRKRK